MKIEKLQPATEHAQHLILQLVKTAQGVDTIVMRNFFPIF